MTQKIVLATGNKGKVKELAKMLAPLNFDVVPQSEFDVPEVAETGTTFVENAIIKARHAAAITGLPAIADDSGLAVDALNGSPGVYSARYASVDATDQDNIDKMLIEMAGIPSDNRSARFLCVLVYMQSAEDPTPIICQGEWHGSITEQQYGEKGFGYDPIFWVAGQECTAAELSADLKNQLSHRADALTKLTKKLENHLG